MPFNDFLKRTFLSIKSHKKLFINGIKWTLLATFLLLTIRFVNINEIKDSLLLISLPTFFLYLTFLCVSRIFYAARWKLVYDSFENSTSVPIGKFFTTNLLAEFVTIALPTSIGGEVTRFFKINPSNNDPIATTTSIFIDRLLGISTMVIDSIIVLILMGQDFSLDIEGFIPKRYYYPIIAGVILLGVVSLFLAYQWMKSNHFPEKIIDAWKRIKQNRIKLAAALIVSLIAHIMFSISHIVLFQKLYPLPILSIIGVILTPQLARSIPISILGISGGEGLMVFSQMLIGLPESTALTITFISLFARYFFAFCGFIFELLSDGLSFFKTLPKEGK